MNKMTLLRRGLLAAGLAAGLAELLAVPSSDAGELRSLFPRLGGSRSGCGPAFEGVQTAGEPGGTWYWMRSPEEEKRVVIGLFNRYCIRCHAVDGRGVWDIPDVPDFTNARWQATRSDSQLARAILEGRGAVMPPFRGTVTLEEGWALARYLRTFVPGTEASKPDTGPDAERLPKPAVK